MKAITSGPFERIDKSRISGRLNISDAGCVFPEPERFDYPLPVLFWWLDEACKHSKKRKLFQFMNSGSLFIVDPDGLCSCYGSWDDEHPKMRLRYDKWEFLESIHDCFNRILAEFPDDKDIRTGADAVARKILRERRREARQLSIGRDA